MNGGRNDANARPGLIDTLPDADRLLAERRAIVAKVKRDRAAYQGNGYMGERLFKMEEAKVASAVRAKFKAAEVKATEGMVDEAVKQQPDYVAAIHAELDRRANWIDLEEQLNEIEWRLRIRGSDSYLLGGEARLTQS